MEQKTKRAFILVAFGVVLYAAAMNFASVLAFLQKIIGLIFPILLGLIVAFILNVPVKGFENLFARLFSKAKRKPKDALIRGISLILTLLCIVFVIVLAVTIAVPEIVTSAKSIAPLVKEKWPEWMAYLQSYDIDLTEISARLAAIDQDTLTNGLSFLLGSAYDFAASTISGVVSAGFAAVIAIYILLSKNILGAQTKKFLYAQLKEEKADKLCHIATLVRGTYSKFLSGQCVEAILLGVLIFIAYSMFGLPYASLVALLTSLFAFVPYIGAFAACFIGAFLTLLAAPSSVLLGITVYLVVQFIENQFIYPHVVGGSVGLSPLWTLIAALIGGKLFGLPGIIFFIPLFAVLYQLVRENTNRKLAQKHVNTK